MKEDCVCKTALVSLSCLFSPKWSYIPLKGTVFYSTLFFWCERFHPLPCPRVRLRAKRIHNFSCWAVISLWCLFLQGGHAVVSLHLAGYPLHQQHRCQGGQCLGYCLGFFPSPSRLCRSDKQHFQKLKRLGRGLQKMLLVPNKLVKSAPNKNCPGNKKHLSWHVTFKSKF